MNFYAFNIGDYASKTRHLSWDEDLAYRRLLDAYYSREFPLPAELKQVYRLVMAQSKAQRDAVDAVLEEFFQLTSDGFEHERCEQEIARAKEKRGKASASAKRRWGNADAQDLSSEGSANAMRTHMPTHSEGNAPNPNPIKDSGRVVAREPLADLEAKLREAAGWEREPAPNLAVTGPVQAMIDQGADLEADVLPAVRAIASQATTRTSWKYFLPAIKRAMDDRLNAAKLANQPPQENRRNGASNTPRRSSFDLIAEIAAATDPARNGSAVDPGTGDEIHPPSAGDRGAYGTG